MQYIYSILLSTALSPTFLIVDNTAQFDPYIIFLYVCKSVIYYIYYIPIGIYIPKYIQPPKVSHV